MNNKDFEEIEQYAYKRATENLTNDEKHLKDLAKIIARISAFSIAEYHRKVSLENQDKKITHD